MGSLTLIINMGGFPQIGKDIIFYGIKGGINWVGSAYDPVNQNIYIPSNHILINKIVVNQKKECPCKFEHYNLYQKNVQVVME